MKIDMLDSFDDFAPSLSMDMEELEKLFARLSKDKFEVKQTKPIHNLSERLEVSVATRSIAIFVNIFEIISD